MEVVIGLVVFAVVIVGVIMLSRKKDAEAAAEAETSGTTRPSKIKDGGMNQ